MTPDFEDFLLAHDLVPAVDELTARAAAGTEGIVQLGRVVSTDDVDALRHLARRASLVAGVLPEAPPPATDSESASPGCTYSAVLLRALDRLAEKLGEHDAGGYVRPVDVACDVADLVEACTELADRLTLP